MAVLTKSALWDRMKLDVSDESGLVITPLLQPDEALDTDAIDLRLGTHFLVPRISFQPYFCPDDRPGKDVYTRVHIPLGKYLVIPAHQTVLGATLEYLKMPYDVSGQILTKSSVARAFIVIETAPWIHPSYRGCLTLEIANVSNTPVLLYPGRAIGQLVFFRVEPEPEKGLPLKSTYLGPIYPEAPSFKKPQDDLAAIGIRKTWIIDPPHEV